MQTPSTKSGQRVRQRGAKRKNGVQNKLCACKAYRHGQRSFYSTVLSMAWSRTERIREARVAKHAFEEFAVQFDVVPNDNQWQI